MSGQESWKEVCNLLLRAGCKLLFGCKPEEEARGQQLMAWLDGGELPAPLIAQEEIDIITGCQMGSQHLPLLRLLLQHPAIFAADAEGARDGMGQLKSLLDIIGLSPLSNAQLLAKNFSPAVKWCLLDACGKCGCLLGSQDLGTCPKPWS